MSVVPWVQAVVNEEQVTATAMLAEQTDPQQLAEFVVAALELSGRSALQDQVLRRFLDCHSDHHHAAWVIGLSQFARELWYLPDCDGDQPAFLKSRYLKTFYQLAFSRPLSAKARQAAYLLVSYFMDGASWQEAPGDYGLSRDSLDWVSWYEHSYLRDWCDRGSFNTEAAFLSWKFFHISCRYAFDPEMQRQAVDFNGFYAKLQRLQKLGRNTEYHYRLLVDWLGHQLFELKELDISGMEDWDRTLLGAAIRKTESQIEQLASWAAEQ